jgi:archaellum component FlaF (FlaF/FlaG flagellin family)
MEAFILRNEHENLGLALVGEARKVKTVVYDSMQKMLIVNFDNGDSETLETEINVSFNGRLLNNREIFVAHFKQGKLNEEPSDEYVVKLDF